MKYISLIILFFISSHLINSKDYSDTLSTIKRIEVSGNRDIKLNLFDKYLIVEHSDGLLDTIGLAIRNLDNPILPLNNNLGLPNIQAVLLPSNRIGNKSFINNFSLFLSYSDNWWYSNPSTAYSGVVPHLGKLSLGINYQLNNDNNIYIQVANDYIPHYRIDYTEDGESFGRPIQTIESVLLGYRYDLSWLEFYSGLVPYAQAAIGQSVYGAAGRSAIGINYTPESMITLSAGYEISGYLLSNSGEDAIISRSGPLLMIMYNL